MTWFLYLAIGFAHWLLFFTWAGYLIHSRRGELSGTQQEMLAALSLSLFFALLWPATLTTVTVLWVGGRLGRLFARREEL